MNLYVKFLRNLPIFKFTKIHLIFDYFYFFMANMQNDQDLKIRARIYADKLQNDPEFKDYKSPLAKQIAIIKKTEQLFLSQSEENRPRLDPNDYIAVNKLLDYQKMCKTLEPLLEMIKTEPKPEPIYKPKRSSTEKYTMEREDFNEFNINLDEFEKLLIKFIEAFTS